MFWRATDRVGRWNYRSSESDLKRLSYEEITKCKSRLVVGGRLQRTHECEERDGDVRVRLRLGGDVRSDAYAHRDDCARARAHATFFCTARVKHVRTRRRAFFSILGVSHGSRFAHLGTSETLFFLLPPPPPPPPAAACWMTFPQAAALGRNSEGSGSSRRSGWQAGSAGLRRPGGRAPPSGAIFRRGRDAPTSAPDHT